MFLARQNGRLPNLSSVPFEWNIWVTYRLGEWLWRHSKAQSPFPNECVSRHFLYRIDRKNRTARKAIYNLQMENSGNANLERAIDAAKGITALAKALGLKSHSVVNQWRKNRVPAEYCPQIELLTGIRCEDLRPDVRWDVLRATSQASTATPQPAAQGA